MKRFFLVDCNNFYVSCERVFNPTLRNKPVVVLGSNDACIIARSNEAKALGIPMGAPAFEYAALFKKHNVIVYSANFALYGDMSHRVMETLASYAPDIEIYSVDEAFLSVSRYNRDRATPGDTYYSEYASFLRTEVKKRTGIPVAIGIGPTKTLAKVANHLAKKSPFYQGVLDITDHPEKDRMLESVAVEDIWGIGFRYARLLRSKQIFTARQFIAMDEAWVRKHMTIAGLKTLWELRGISCVPLLEGPEPRKSITVSRLFGKTVTDIVSIKEAVATYVSTAAFKMRAQGSCAGYITVFIMTSRYHDPENYFRSAGAVLPTATSYTPHLITAAHACVDRLFKPGLMYKKVGIMVSDLVTADTLQLHFFSTDSLATEKQTGLIKTIDKINTRWGRDTVFFAAAGTDRRWSMYQAQKSNAFTTQWHELLTVTLS